MACMEGRQQLALTGNQDTKMHFFWLDSGLRTAEVDSLGLGVGLEVRQGILQEFSELAPKAVKRKWPDFSRQQGGVERAFSQCPFHLHSLWDWTSTWHFPGISQALLSLWRGGKGCSGLGGARLGPDHCGVWRKHKLQTALKQHCSHRHWW